MSKLSEKEKEVLQTWLDVWDTQDCLIPGCINYQTVIDVITKFKLEMPPKLGEIADGSFERWAASVTQALELDDSIGIIDASGRRGVPCHATYEFGIDGKLVEVEQPVQVTDGEA